MAGRGWYVMHRGWMLSGDFRPEPFTDREAYIWSIEQAAHSQHFQWFNGREIFVERGEFATSIRKMAERFSWTEKEVRGFLERMCRVKKWALRKAGSAANSPTIIIVCNYNEYQSLGGRKGTAEGTTKDTQLDSLRAREGHIAGTQQNEHLKKGRRILENEWNHSSSRIRDGDFLTFPPSAWPRRDSD